MIDRSHRELSAKLAELNAKALAMNSAYNKYRAGVRASFQKLLEHLQAGDYARCIEHLKGELSDGAHDPELLH